MSYEDNTKMEEFAIKLYKILLLMQDKCLLIYLFRLFHLFIHSLVDFFILSAIYCECLWILKN